MNEVVDALRSRRVWPIIGVVAGVAAFALVFLVVDQAFFRFADARFPNVGESAVLATLWGLVSRLHVLVPALVIAVWRPDFVGAHLDRIASHWRMLTAMLLVTLVRIASGRWSESQAKL